MEYHGTLAKPDGSGAEFSVFKGLLTDNEAAQLLSMGSQLLSGEIGSGRGRELDLDGRPRFAVEVAELGVITKHPQEIRPLLENVLLPLLRKFSPTIALSSAYFRRYVPEERRYLPPHYEYGSFVVVSIPLQEASAYTGGFFVQGSGKAFLDRKFLQLSRGDVCVYQYLPARSGLFMAFLGSAPYSVID